MNIDKKFVKALGFSDFREFFIDLGNWYHTTDFTYAEKDYTHWRAGLRRYVREMFDDEEADRIISNYL